MVGEGSIAPSDIEGDLGGFQFERTVRGVREIITLDAGLITSADARAIHRSVHVMQEIYGELPNSSW